MDSNSQIANILMNEIDKIAQLSELPEPLTVEHIRCLAIIHKLLDSHKEVDITDENAFNDKMLDKLNKGF